MAGRTSLSATSEQPDGLLALACPGCCIFARRRVIVETNATKRSTDFIALLERLDQAYGRQPGRRPDKPVVMAIDNGPIH